MREIPDTGFAGDDGAPDPDLRQALVAAEAGANSGAALGLLLRARLLVPVVAVPGAADEHADDDATRETSSDIAAVLMTGRDGRRALLAFSGTDALSTWNPQARPVPVSAVQAARAALEEDASAVVVDVAGPAMFVLEGADLHQAAAGSVLVRIGSGYGWTRPDGDATTGPV